MSKKENSQDASTQAPTEKQDSAGLPKPDLHVVSNDPVATTNFSIIIRGIQQADHAGLPVTRDTPSAAFEQALAVDVANMVEPVMRWKGRDRLVALDFDRPDGAPPVDENDLIKYFPQSLPQPLFAWPTHDFGLRVIFVETPEGTAMELAGAWYMLAPLGYLVGWSVEVKTDTRHPHGERGGVRCGYVTTFSPSGNLVVPGARGRSVASQEEIDDWLVERGLRLGRHGGEHCPWCGGATATCNPCLIVDERGAHCFRCGRSASWDWLVGRLVAEDRPSVYDAARACVHLPHQELVLGDLRPNVPPELLEPAWAAMLRQAHADHLKLPDMAEREAWDARIKRAASNRIDIVRSSMGEWLDRKTLTVRRVSADRTLKYVPWAMSPVMVDAAANAAPLHGFTGVHPIKPAAVIGPYVEPPIGSIFVRRALLSTDPPPVDLGLGPPLPAQVESAWSAVETRLPGVDRAYTHTLLIVGLVAQRAVGTPPLVIVTGPTGAGKTAVQHLVAGMLGTKAGLISLDGDADDVNRRLGLKLAAGCGFLFVDEVGRVKNLYWKLEPVLSANSDLTFRAKYANEVVTPLVAPISLLGSTLPSSVVRSPELARRAVGIRLRGANKVWLLTGDPLAVTGGGQTKPKVALENARTLDSVRPHLDTITASIWWALHAAGPGGDWRDLCMKSYGAVPLSDLDLLDSDSAGREEAVRQLYEAFRAAKPEDLTTGTTWSGWLPANPGTNAGDLLGGLIDFEDRERQGGDIADLERLNLEPVLGFPDPQLVLRVQRRSGKFLVKFIEVGVRKGDGRDRAQFPQSVPPKNPDDQRERVRL